jgi:hypothetical protein
VLSGRGLCNELITLPEESYRLWCVVVLWSRNLVNEESLAYWRTVAPKERKTERQTTSWRQSSVCRQRNVGRNLQGISLWQVIADHYVVLPGPPIFICKKTYCGNLIYACRQRSVLPNQQQFGRHWHC